MAGGTIGRIRVASARDQVIRSGIADVHRLCRELSSFRGCPHSNIAATVFMPETNGSS